MQQEKGKKARTAAAHDVGASGAGAVSGPWVTTGIAVKVMAKGLGDYYKRKGIVVSVVDTYVAEVEMSDSGDVLRIDQAELETVSTSSWATLCVPCHARGVFPIGVVVQCRR